MCCKIVVLLRIVYVWSVVDAVLCVSGCCVLYLVFIGFPSSILFLVHELVIGLHPVYFSLCSSMFPLAMYCQHWDLVVESKSVLHLNIFFCLSDFNI